MIVKPFTEGNAIERLTALLADNSGRSKAIETEIRKVRAGLKGERDAAHYIDTTLAGSNNYAVIHGLRLETPQGVTQLDHVIITRLLMVFVLETKHFSSGLKITEEGEFLRWSNYERRYQAMESPLMQCDRHEIGLRNFLKATPVFPTRLGIRMSPDIKSLVLVTPEAQLYRPTKFNTSKVVKADQFFDAMNKEFDKIGIIGGWAKMAQAISSGTLREIAESLASHDKPIDINYAGKLGIRQSSVEVTTHSVQAPVDIVPSPTEAIDVATTLPDVAEPAAYSDSVPSSFKPLCKSCQSTTGDIRFGKFGYYWKCLSCDGNTKLALPGSCKLRKESLKFYYVEEGKPEVLLHTNTAQTTSTSPSDRP